MESSSQDGLDVREVADIQICDVTPTRGEGRFETERSDIIAEYCENLVILDKLPRGIASVLSRAYDRKHVARWSSSFRPVSSSAYTLVRHCLRAFVFQPPRSLKPRPGEW
jgi:hypothetical protein